MDWLTLWWVWIGIALALGILEILLPSFIFLGFSLGALALGAGFLVMPGALQDITLNPLLALYAGLSLLAWIGLKFAFRKQSSGAQTFTKDIND